MNNYLDGGIVFRLALYNLLHIFILTAQFFFSPFFLDYKNFSTLSLYLQVSSRGKTSKVNFTISIRNLFYSLFFFIKYSTATSSLNIILLTFILWYAETWCFRFWCANWGETNESVACFPLCVYKYSIV